MAVISFGKKEGTYVPQDVKIDSGTRSITWRCPVCGKIATYYPKEEEVDQNGHFDGKLPDQCDRPYGHNQTDLPFRRSEQTVAYNNVYAAGRMKGKVK